MAQNDAGDEFRANGEVIAKFFTADGRLDEQALQRLHGDISELILPSPARGLALDKAYRGIVAEQSFARGRDAALAPAENVLRQVEAGTGTGVEAAIAGP